MAGNFGIGIGIPGLDLNIVVKVNLILHHSFPFRQCLQSHGRKVISTAATFLHSADLSLHCHRYASLRMPCNRWVTFLATTIRPVTSVQLLWPFDKLACPANCPPVFCEHRVTLTTTEGNRRYFVVHVSLKRHAIPRPRPILWSS